MTCRLIGAAAAACLCVAASAQAADLAIPRTRALIGATTWNGFYAGLNAGYNAATLDWSLSPGGLSLSGATYGLTLGFNYQAAAIVWGVEGDFNVADIDGTLQCIGIVTCQIGSRWLATVRGRVGYAIGGFLPYLTGGLAAVGDIQASTVPAAATVTSDQVGYAVGGGLEISFLGKWSAKLEYLHVDAGSIDIGFIGPPAAGSVSFKQNIIRAGVNYRFFGL